MRMPTLLWLALTVEKEDELMKHSLRCREGFFHRGAVQQDIPAKDAWLKSLLSEIRRSL